MTEGRVILYLVWAVLIAPLPVFLVWQHMKDSAQRRQRYSRGQDASPTAARILSRMRRKRQTTLLLTPTQSPGFSKLGGQPELPSDTAWPEAGGAPRAFLAQLDLTDVKAAGGPDWLPEAGRLYAFVDINGAGLADYVRVIHSLEPGADAAAWPEGLPQKLRFPERRAGFLALPSTPSLDWLGIDVREIDVSDEELDTLSDTPAEPFGDELQHRIGGYPSEIQETRMALECEHLARGLPSPSWDEEIPPAIDRASKSWRLLLQIDSDPALKMNWGDAGRLYVFIREKHATAADFSRTVTLWETH